MIDGIVSENDPKLVLEEDDFSPDVDSTMLIRERTRGSKLEATFKKKTAQPIGESDHTVTILPSRGSPVVLSQRDIAIERKEANNPGPSKRQEVSEDEISSSEEGRPKQVNLPNSQEMPNESELPIEEEVLEGSETSGEVHMPKRKTTRLETVSTEEEEMKEDTKYPEEKEKGESPRKGGKTRSGRTVKKPKWLGHNVMVSAIKKAEAK